MGREEQSGRDARGPQSGSEMIVSDVAPPVPSPIRLRGGSVRGVWERARVRALRGYFRNRCHIRLRTLCRAKLRLTRWPVPA
jgi:hypothetical protein